MEQKNPFTRKNLPFYLEIYNQHSGELLGYLGDISADQVVILSDHPLPLEELIDLNIRLPDLEGFIETGLEVRVETQWDQPDVDPKWHCTGCLLVDIAPEDESLIDQIQDVLEIGR